MHGIVQQIEQLLWFAGGIIAAFLALVVWAGYTVWRWYSSKKHKR